jgi:hypothetical protein
MPLPRHFSPFSARYLKANAPADSERYPLKPFSRLLSKSYLADWKNIIHPYVLQKVSILAGWGADFHRLCNRRLMSVGHRSS